MPGSAGRDPEPETVDVWWIEWIVLEVILETVWIVQFDSHDILVEGKVWCLYGLPLEGRVIMS